MKQKCEFDEIDAMLTPTSLMIKKHLGAWTRSSHNFHADQTMTLRKAP